MKRGLFGRWAKKNKKRYPYLENRGEGTKRYITNGYDNHYVHLSR